jgi:hypothetical protein
MRAAYIKPLNVFGLDVNDLIDHMPYPVWAKLYYTPGLQAHVDPPLRVGNSDLLKQHVPLSSQLIAGGGSLPYLPSTATVSGCNHSIHIERNQKHWEKCLSICKPVLPN